MKWSKETPTEPGFYLGRDPSGGDCQLILEYRRPDYAVGSECVLTVAAAPEWFKALVKRGAPVMWAGPIKPEDEFGPDEIRAIEDWEING